MFVDSAVMPSPSPNNYFGLFFACRTMDFMVLATVSKLAEKEHGKADKPDLWLSVYLGLAPGGTMVNLQQSPIFDSVKATPSNIDLYSMQ
jgi:hypothetical protein